MGNSFQKEIPNARINITLDLETGGAKKNIELPLNLLMIGDYSGGKTIGPVAEREKIKVNKENFNDVLKSLNPEIDLTVDNKISNDGSDLKVNLSFESLRSFEPDEIVQQVPELKNLIAMRNLLKDFRSNVMDNVTFRKKLEAIAKEREKLNELNQQLKSLTIQTVSEALENSDDAGIDP